MLAVTKQLRTSLFRYLVVGVSGTLVNLVSLALLANLPVARFIAATISTEISIIHNFLLNDSWTFRERRATLMLGRFGRFQIVSIGTATLTVGLFAFFNSVLGWHYIFSQLVAIGLATILNFSLNFKLTWPRQANLEGVTGLNPQLNKAVNFEIEYEETPGC
jgi:dolichol-phosphate mannosyltransferase